MGKIVRQFKVLAIWAAIIAIGALTLKGYADSLEHYITNSALDVLTETAVQQKFNVQQGLTADGRILEEVAFFIGKAPDALKESKELLTDTVHRTHFDALNFFDMNGARVLSSGFPFELPDNFAKEKTTWGISGYRLFQRDSTDFFIAVPVYDGPGNQVGLLVGAHPIEKMREVLLPFFRGNGSTYVVSKSGQLVASSGSLNGWLSAASPGGSFWDNLEHTAYVGYDSAAQMEANLAHNGSGNMLFYADGMKKYAHYEPVGMNDWYVFTVVGQDTVSSQMRGVLRFALGLFFIGVAAFTVLLIYLLWKQRKYRAQLERVAFYDDLCGCPSLQKFKLDMQKHLDGIHDEMLLMVKLDIDRFKLVNQTFGAETGDEVLKHLAKALQKQLGEGAFCYARAHDDQFYILYEYTEQKDLAFLMGQFRKHFLTLLGEEFHYHIQFVFGAYYITLENCRNAVDAIEKVNFAHQRAKTLRKELCIYDETYVREALRKKDIEERMEAALEDNEFQIYFQPQYSLKDESMIGAEALVRWLEKDGTMIYPNEFIPLFEENNFIIHLDMYMFEKACQSIQGWLAEGISPVQISVNFARNHLTNANFVNELCEITERYGVPHNLLEVELTERAISQDEQVSMKVLERLHENGFALSMDDFGTGYSSLGLLKNIPVDIIKLDKSFFDQADDQPRSRAVLINVIQLATDLNAYTIAEGVETEETVEMLKEYGCNAVQGFYFSHPVCEVEFQKKLMKSGCKKT